MGLAWLSVSLLHVRRRFACVDDEFVLALPRCLFLHARNPVSQKDLPTALENAAQKTKGALEKRALRENFIFLSLYKFRISNGRL